METRHTILIVDDDIDFTRLLELRLTQEGYRIETAYDGEAALEKMRRRWYSLIILDYQMPKLDGLEVLRLLKRIRPEAFTILITAHSSEKLIIEAFRLGIKDFFAKPIDQEEVVGRINRLLEGIPPELFIGHMMDRRTRFDDIIGMSEPMQKIYGFIEKTSKETVNVLITGETGTGKELVARAIHRHSANRDGPFVVVNCAGIPESLLESELFGHEKGAFTGAIRLRRGAFELANNGTLFLDEIAEMSLGIQAKILRAIETKEFTRLGGEHPIKVTLRVIAATNRDLVKEVLLGRFRKDLYYRLNVAQVHLPLLRERREDIPLLVDYFIDYFNKRYGCKVRVISPEALSMFFDYKWDGNVRELRNFLEVTMAGIDGDVIRPEHLSTYLRQEEKKGKEDVSVGGFLEGVELREGLLDEVEERLIRWVLSKTNGNKSKASRILGVAKNTLKAKMKKYGISLR
jgi:DNA-binding NtrC family response regulator